MFGGKISIISYPNPVGPTFSVEDEDRQNIEMMTTSTQEMTLTSLPAFTTPEVKVVLGAIVVACALVGLPILFVTINYLRNAAHSHGQAINRWATFSKSCCVNSEVTLMTFKILINL